MRWCSVEVLQEGKHSSASDVWAYGVTVYEIMSDGGTPYSDLPTLLEVAAAIKAGRNPGCPATCPPSVHDRLMVPCWEVAPADRPTFTDLHDAAVSLGGQDGVIDDGGESGNSSGTASPRDDKAFWSSSEGQRLHGVSIQHLSTTFSETARAATAGAWGGESTADPTVWQVVQAHVKPKTSKRVCPKDGESGCAYIDLLTWKHGRGASAAVLS